VGLQKWGLLRRQRCMTCFLLTMRACDCSFMLACGVNQDVASFQWIHLHCSSILIFMIQHLYPQFS
jgi:hypothetical protein